MRSETAKSRTDILREDGLAIVLKHTRIFRPVTSKVQHVISDSFRLLNIHKL